jgi:hypothetical protein
MITQKEIKKFLSYHENTGIFISKVNRGYSLKEGDGLGILRKDGYISIMIDRKSYKSHRLAWLYVTGEYPKNTIDHKNRKKSDNKFENLRDITHKKNCQNRGKRKDNKSGVTGVYRNAKRNNWVCGIRIDGKYYHLGSFKNFDSAVEARKEALKEFKFYKGHGE